MVKGEENEIKNMSVYLSRMQKSMIDKTFFADKVFEPFENLVDFGCANGELIKAISSMFGDECRYFGYDNNPKMISAARENVPFATFVSDWDDLKVDPKNTLLNISSTIHEVYSYCTGEETELFWHRVLESGFKYITIREMMVSDKTARPASNDDLNKLYAEKKYSDNLKSYESMCGKVKSEKDLIHYLLKYSYTDNWEREVKENYLALSLESFKALIPDDYEVTYFDHFTLPFIADRVKKDFDIELKTPTHIKIILKKREI